LQTRQGGLNLTHELKGPSCLATPNFFLAEKYFEILNGEEENEWKPSIILLDTHTYISPKNITANLFRTIATTRK